VLVKRDPRLHGLSTDHHHSLVLALRIRREVSDNVSPKLVREVQQTFADTVQPHFDIEEAMLLPALREIPEGVRLVERTLVEHAAIRQSVVAIGDQATAARLLEFARRLHDHVRFEENELFPACERFLPAAVLDTVARLAPKA
jgi:hemerythrin-like domain-containing protein